MCRSGIVPPVRLAEPIEKTLGSIFGELWTPLEEDERSEFFFFIFLFLGNNSIVMAVVERGLYK